MTVTSLHDALLRPGALEALVKLLLDDLLDRPLSELVEPEWLAARFAEGLRATADDARTEVWVRGRVDELLRRVEAQEGTLRDRLPEGLADPLRRLVARPVSPNADLLRTLMDHATMRALMREVLQATLQEFADKVRTATAWAPKPAAPKGRLGALVGVAQGVASAMGGELERQLDGRIQQTLDGAISRSIDLSVARLCAPEFAPELGIWRADGLDVVLDTPLGLWRSEARKLDPDGLVAEVATLLRALARWDGLQAGLTDLVRASLEGSGGRSARELLEGSGLEEGWRPHAEALMVERATAFVAGEAFAAWLGALQDDP